MRDGGSETQAFFESAQAIEKDRPAFDRMQLFSFLQGALVRLGHLRVADPSAELPSRETPPALLVIIVFWGLGGGVGLALDVGALYWGPLGVGLFILLGLVGAATSHAEALGVLIAGAWAVLAVVLAITNPGALIWTYAAPAGALLVLRVVLGRLHLRQARDFASGLAGVARSAPFVAPVVLLVILLPALTADVWRLAAEVTASNVVGAALVSIGTLFALVGRQLARELELALASRCRALKSRNPGELTRQTLAAELGLDDRAVLTEIPDEVLAGTWPDDPSEYAPYLAAAEGRTLRRPLFGRLAITTAVIGCLLTVYIYVLLAVTVPVETASAWTGETVVSHSLLLGATVPGGAYLVMSALLGVLATAIFLAFALTEERFTAALTTALLRDPIDRFLSLSVPLLALLEWSETYDGPLSLGDNTPNDSTTQPSSGGASPSS